MGLFAPWFLAALAGVALPLYLHLLKKHNRPPKPVPSLMLYESRVVSSTKHRRLDHILLLTLRLLLPMLNEKTNTSWRNQLSEWRSEWEKLMATHKDAPVKSYSMKSSFALGDKLNHPSFGDGIVGKLIYPNKLEVIFRHDVKVLIHGGAHI